MVAKAEKTKRKGTKKNNVVLREKKLANDNLSLYLDIYRDGVRSYEFLKLYVNANPRTPADRLSNKETLELAETIRTQRESELNHSAFGIVAPTKQKVLYQDYVNSYIKSYSKKDLRMIQAVNERFKDFLTAKMPGIKLGALLITKIDKSMVVRFVDYLKEKSSGEGGHSYFKRFKKILKSAVEKGIIASSPAVGVAYKTTEGLRKNILSNEEIKMLAQTPCQNSNIKRAFILCCCTGLRFCDVVGLTYSSIDFASGRLKVDQAKTGKPVMVDLNSTARKMIGEPGEPDALVYELPTSNGCNSTLDAWVKRAGISKHITWHCARHSFAVNLLTSSEKPDIKTVSSTLGHTSLKHTEKYTRVVDELKKKAVNALPEYDF